ncbi:MAG: M15 family metallopeptidase [Dehalococcoidia bacterium]
MERDIFRAIRASAAIALPAFALVALTLLAACTGAGTEERSPTPFAPSPTISSPDPSLPTLSLTPTPVPTQAAVPDDEDSPGLLMIVDKEHGLPSAYVPPSLVEIPPEWMAPGLPSRLLRKEAAEALIVMLRAARAEGHELRASSAYRSYEEQATTFRYWIDQLGEEEARRVSAPPGHSEHQLGTTVDLTSASVGWQLEQRFGQTPEGQWLAAHAHEYGFPLSYPQGVEEITGYTYEPWHFRYIGQDQAASWAQSGLTLVEFLKQLTDQDVRQ